MKKIPQYWTAPDTVTVNNLDYKAGQIASQETKIDNLPPSVSRPSSITKISVGIRLPDCMINIGRQRGTMGKTVADRIASCGGSILPFQKNF